MNTIMHKLFCPSCYVYKRGRAVLSESGGRVTSTRSVCSECGSFLKIVESRSVLPPQEQQTKGTEVINNQQVEKALPSGVLEHIATAFGSTFTFEQVLTLMGMMEKQLSAAKVTVSPNINFNLDEHLFNREPQPTPKVQESAPKRIVRRVERDEQGLIVRVIEEEVD